MIVLHSAEEFKGRVSVVALGMFDGVHVGHQKLIREAVRLAKEMNAVSIVCTFDRHPLSVLRPERAPEPLLTLEENLEKFARLGADAAFIQPFTKAFAEMLRDQYRGAVVVCGDNFRFGRNAAGKPADLEAFGLETHVVPPVVYGSRVVSSTYIRESVRDGRVGRAKQLLGRPFFLEGPIVGGFQVGRTLGYPTINIRVENGILMPHRGVYVSRVTVDGQSFQAVTNVGTRPTFTDADIVSVESHLLNFSGDIYGHEARVDFLKYLRPERGFSDGEALRQQITRDIQQALDYHG